LFNFHDPLKFFVLGTSAAGALALLAVFAGEMAPGAGAVVCVMGPAGACATADSAKPPQTPKTSGASGSFQLKRRYAM